MRAILNVGGGGKALPIPERYKDWRHDLLDSDSRAKPTICLDPRQMVTSAPAVYDAIYCGQNLQYYYRHDALKVVRGFAHVLKPNGFVEVIVPDTLAIIKAVVEKGLDLGDVLFTSPAGPILVRDMLYGYQPEIQASGNDRYSHKNGFSSKTLVQIMADGGFPMSVVQVLPPYAVGGIFFKQQPTDEQRALFGIRA